MRNRPRLREWGILFVPVGHKLAVKMRVLLAIWLVLLMAISVSPLSFKLKLHTVGTYHNLGHYLAYTLTGIVLWLSAERLLTKALAFIFGLGVAAGQEWLENRLYHAGFEWKDVATDLAGLLTGLAVMLLITALTTAPRTHRSRAR